MFMARLGAGPQFTYTVPNKLCQVLLGVCSGYLDVRGFCQNSLRSFRSWKIRQTLSLASWNVITKYTHIMVISSGLTILTSVSSKHFLEPEFRVLEELRRSSLLSTMCPCQLGLPELRFGFAAVWDVCKVILRRRAPATQSPLQNQRQFLSSTKTSIKFHCLFFSPALIFSMPRHSKKQPMPSDRQKAAAEDSKSPCGNHQHRESQVNQQRRMPSPPKGKLQTPFFYVIISTKLLVWPTRHWRSLCGACTPQFGGARAGK